MHLETLAPLTWLIPLPPLLAFFLIVLFTNRNKALSHTVALVCMLTSWALSWYLFFQVVRVEHFGHEVIESAVNWLPFGSEEVGTEALKMGVLVDPLTAIMLFFVPLCCVLIFVYSIGYHNFGKPRDAHDMPGNPPHGGIEPMYSRFFAFLSLFACGMLTLVVADNLLLMFVGWEIMGLCSYLLIGFWYAREYPDQYQITPRQASVKAFLTTRVGDVFMMLGIVYLYTITDTLSFREILYNEEVLHHLAEMPSVIVGLPAAGLIGLLLFTGTVGKSAQFPLHFWLPDAMEGPTPVSAMIHAATMVSAGVYAMIRMYPLMSAGWHHGSPLTAPMAAMAFIGAFTALFAATIAVAQNDVKKVLAYSTISQLGYMIAALGIGAYVAAVFHLMTHAFFKALLFLGSGSVIHGVEHGVHHTHDHIDPQDMRNMGGLKDRMPWTFWTFLIGGFALSGFPFITAGFWSKDAILGGAFEAGQWVVFGTLALSALLTAFYTMRQISLTFLGQPRTKAAAHATEDDPIFYPIILALVPLAFFAIAAGWVGIPNDFLGLQLGEINWIHEFVGGTLLEHPPAEVFNIIPLLTSILVAGGGLLIGWWLYKDIKANQADPLEAPLGPVYTLLKNKYYFDTGKYKTAAGEYGDNLIQALFVRPTVWLSEVFVSIWVDKNTIDSVLHGVSLFALNLGTAFRTYFEKPVINDSPDHLANGVQRFGRSIRVIQTGRIQQYLVVIMVIVIAIGATLFAVGR